MNPTQIQLLSISLILVVSPLSAQVPAAIETDCLLMVLDQVELSARRDGVLKRLHVRMGDNIQRGELAFELSQDEANANLSVAAARHRQAQMRAGNQANVKAAEVELARSTKEASMLDDVGRVPYLERFRAENTKSKNAAELEVVQMTHKEDVLASEVTKAELEVARIDLTDRKTVSPINGTVVKQLRFRGDWCKQGEPVLKILRMDQMMLQGIVNVRDIAPSRVMGMRVSVTFRMAGDAPIEMNGLRITKVSPEVDLDGNYLVWTFVENRTEVSSSGETHWLLRPGISGVMTISPAASRDPSRKVARR